MIKLIENLQQSPEALHQLVKDNLNNNNIAEFISAPEFLAKTNLRLERLDEVPFFIKYVFRIVRQPQLSQMEILNDYIQASDDKSIKKLVECLLEAFQKDHQINLDDYLEHLYASIIKGEEKETKAILQECLYQKFKPCISLLSFLQKIMEDNNWQNDQYKLKLMILVDQAFQNLALFPNQIQLYMLILTSLFSKTLTSPLDDFSLLILLMQQSSKHPLFIRKIIRDWQKQTQKQIPRHIASCAIFKYFTCVFDHQIYFKEDSSKLLDAVNLSEEIYDLVKQDFAFEELGWISVFSISKWINEDISEESLYKGIAFLRENNFQRSDIISEIIVFSIARVMNQSPFKILPIFQILFSTLTQKQMKYLTFKLDQTLLPSVKEDIIISAIEGKVQNITILALYFSQTTVLEVETVKEIQQFKKLYLKRWNDIIDQIEHSRYNSLQKSIKIFKEWCRFLFCEELRCFKLKSMFSLASILRFFKDLFINDYFSEEYWINEQKISNLLLTNQKFQQKLDMIFDFLEYEKIVNLSGAMILTEALRQSAKIDFKFSKKQADFLVVYINHCLKLLKTEVFISNITIILDFLLVISELALTSYATDTILAYFKNETIKIDTKSNAYTKIMYNIEAAILNLLHNGNHISKLNQYIHNMVFYRTKEEFAQGPRDNRQKIARLYQRYNIQINDKIQFKELLTYKDTRKLILTQLQPQSLMANINKISELFQFHSPLFNGQIVALTHLAHSPQQNYYFRNHFCPFIQHEYVKIYALTAQKTANKEVNQSIFNCGMHLLQQVLKGDTFSHGQKFYKSLNKSQLVYALLTNKNLHLLSNSQIKQIIAICLQIIEKDNYPLLRQYISVSFCRAYLILVKRMPEGTIRRELIEKMRVNINIGVPIALTLGYELIQSCRLGKKGSGNAQIESIHELLVKFISCHTAYLRAICQYYLYLYLDMTDTKDQFLNNLKLFWNEDKDSQKILTNVSMVVEGFKEGVQHQCDFLGFERVQEYPTNRLKMQFYCSTAKFYSQFILNEFLEKDFHSKEMYKAINQAAAERYEELKSNYLHELQLFQSNQSERTVKSNMKKVTKEEKIEPVRKEKAQPAKKEKPKKEDKHKKGKNKERAAEPQKEKIKQQLKDYPLFKLQLKYRMLSSKQQLSGWYRRKLDPKIIVIATLLQKVHNFGHILRTLHRGNAMLVVPSIQPLLHPQCKQLVPAGCDVQIVEIRQRDLHKFITLMKSLGYPLVALEQCSRSVMVEQAKFPEKFMMLLGNQRIGAPSALLNQGDLLVQIPQIGKIRSLNVHVSMVICLWEFLSK